MGLIDFVKSAGEDLLQRVKGGPDIDAAGITKSIKSHGIDVQNLSVSVDDDVAIVSGKTKSQTDREKVVLVAGNTQGVARVDDRLEVAAAPAAQKAAPPEPESTYYEVKKGDSLSKIAKAHYGDPMKYKQVFEANRPMLTDPDKIYPGQVLRLPPL